MKEKKDIKALKTLIKLLKKLKELEGKLSDSFKHEVDSFVNKIDPTRRADSTIFNSDIWLDECLLLLEEFS